MQQGDLIQDRYRLENQLGTGGMATVWSALDERLQRPVAIKLMAPHLAGDPDFLIRFFSEAQCVAKISDPAVVKVLDFGQQDDLPYLVMELVPGGSLDLPDGEKLLPERALELVAQAARGAGAAHVTGLVHRDIKPANILLDQDGNAKLADFGIASSAGGERMTGTGTAIGSPHYISPEQVSGGDASPASDVYALGVVLYELLTGEKPFDGGNPTAIAIAHIERTPEPPSSHDPSLDPGIDAVVMRCLEKDPARRFPDGCALAEVLESAHVGGALALAAAAEHFEDEDEEDDEILVTGGRRALVGSLAAVVVLALAVWGFAATRHGTDSSSDMSGTGTTPTTTVQNGKGKGKPSPSATVGSEDQQLVVATPSPSPSQVAGKDAGDQSSATSEANGPSDLSSDDGDSSSSGSQPDSAFEGYGSGQGSGSDDDTPSDPDPTPATEPSSEPTPESSPSADSSPAPQSTPN
jgi:serine/threonine-protein kinase